MSDYRRNLGRSGEEEAAAFLEEAGCEILERNFRGERGEIDIIARDGKVVVFVEVKTKRKEGFGDPEEWVGRRKQAQIGKVALAYLQQKNLLEADCRFDVIAVDRSQPGGRLRHIKDAFWLDA